jgi:hypothetical protein
MVMVVVVVVVVVVGMLAPTLHGVQLGPGLADHLGVKVAALAGVDLHRRRAAGADQVECAQAMGRKLGPVVVGQALVGAERRLRPAAICRRPGSSHAYRTCGHSTACAAACWRSLPSWSPAPAPVSGLCLSQLQPQPP